MKTWMFLLSLVCAGPAFAELPADARVFAEELEREHGIEAGYVLEKLGEARRSQAVLDAISRPAERKAWHEYRKIFLTPARIGQGVLFWEQHEETIARAAKTFAVDPELIVSIIGVETFYGSILGNFRAIDALSTLAFYYPPRASFFRGELAQLFVLANEGHVDLGVKGSYAGAIGLGQFIPSSYRAYAVDFDQDGAIDLRGSVEDAIGSVANYLARHGWRAGEPVAVEAIVDDAAAADAKKTATVAQFAASGIRPAVAMEGSAKATLRDFEQPSSTDWWLTFHNFDVVMRYNRSQLYALAVHQLAQEIVARKG